MAPSSAFVSYNSSTLSDDPCPECNLTFLTKPKLCTGHHSPRNKGRFYQECNFKEYDNHPCCNFFRWRDDIPRALANVQDNDSMQQNFPSTPSRTFSVPSSQSSTPLRQRVARQPCANLSCSERGHHTGHRNLQCVLKYCKTCCQKTGMSCPAPRHNEPVTPATNSITVTPRTPSTSTNSTSMLPAGFSFERPMAKSIDPSFAQKVLNGEHDPNISVSDRFQRELYRKQNVNSIQIKWWSENGAEAQLLTVAAPAHPLFHPKDSGPILRMVGLQNCTDYGYWDGNQWLLTDVAMKIKGNSMLYMRSPGVSDCPGGPKAKRRLSDVEDSPTASRLKSSGLRPLISRIDYSGQSTISPSSDKPNSIISISSTDDNNSEVEVEIVSGISSLPSTSMSTSSHTPTSEAVDPFPREFAHDMDGGFRAMEALRGTVPIRFAEVFKNRWVHGTFYLHWNIWKAMIKDEEGKKLLEAAVECGTNVGGSWSDLTRRFGKKNAGVKSS